MEKTDGKLAFTVDGASERTGLARTRIYHAISDGSLRTFKAGRRRMISARALADFIQSLEEACSAEHPASRRA